MQTDPHASGLPFPPLLRKELFDTRGFPDWYCPTRGARPIAVWALVSGSAFALGMLLFVICVAPHHRIYRLSGSFRAQVPACDLGAVECKAELRIGRPALAEDAVIDRHVGVAVSGNAVAARIVGVLGSAQRGDMTLVVAWPNAVILPTGDVTIALGETRTLRGWLAPKRPRMLPAKGQP